MIALLPSLLADNSDVGDFYSRAFSLEISAYKTTTYNSGKYIAQFLIRSTLLGGYHLTNYHYWRSEQQMSNRFVRKLKQSLFTACLPLTFPHLWNHLFDEIFRLYAACCANTTGGK
jgi:hypothetical protein